MKEVAHQIMIQFSQSSVQSPSQPCNDSSVKKNFVKKKVFIYIILAAKQDNQPMTDRPANQSYIPDKPHNQIKL